MLMPTAPSRRPGCLSDRCAHDTHTHVQWEPLTHPVCFAQSSRLSHVDPVIELPRGIFRACQGRSFLSTSRALPSAFWGKGWDSTDPDSWPAIRVYRQKVKSYDSDCQKWMTGSDGSHALCAQEEEKRLARDEAEQPGSTHQPPPVQQQQPLPPPPQPLPPPPPRRPLTRKAPSPPPPPEPPRYEMRVTAHEPPQPAGRGTRTTPGRGTRTMQGDEDAEDGEDGEDGEDAKDPDEDGEMEQALEAEEILDGHVA
eukprot:gnl/TRDRNA2_/TRDRNA2_133071_c0_seq1.p1 gnl/TRDRNA2_/TRDRNA2_133071_c0~~gnl/TRDRNA2_/TRDRNA2_133071_c0_seq1.p1  ORF type:complete len:254 (+),score=28.83 gnl/TRDRNA2_/TRDRNA2_133071_c0_seq1:42-803(+)